MVVGSTELLHLLEKIADRIEENKEYLTELDLAIGDADHGLNMDRGFKAVKARFGGWSTQTPSQIVKGVGSTLVSTVGGASGPLYGTAFLSMGQAIDGKERIASEDLLPLAEAAIAGIIKRGKASAGDKTMLDTILPVRDALSSLLYGGEADAGAAIAKAAREGMESTKPLLALKGRASFLKERSIGHIDPGAASACLIIEAAVDFLREHA